MKQSATHFSTTDPLAKKPSRVLYIQHARSYGGSAVSLKHLVLSMQNAGIDCTVALAQPSNLFDYYSSYNIRTIPAEGIFTWHHSTVSPRYFSNPFHLVDLARNLRLWRTSQKATLKLVDKVKPDLVHLNSMPLSSSASALTLKGFPYVWHVREPPMNQGFRTSLIRSMMVKAPATVFITDYDRRQWVGENFGITVPNPVPDEWFDPNPKLKNNNDCVRFAFLGGLTNKVKGADVLLKALMILQDNCKNWKCIFPGAKEMGKFQEPIFSGFRQKLSRFFVGTLTNQEISRILSTLGERVELFPFLTEEIRPLFQSIDFIVFPALKPHFARPVIEAAAMGLPAIGSNIGDLSDCITHLETGLLCSPNDPKALADSLAEMINNRDFRIIAGQKAFLQAQKLYKLSDHQRNISKIYSQVLSKQK